MSRSIDGATPLPVRAAVVDHLGAPYSIEPLELREPGPGEVLVEVAGTGLCHTDTNARRHAISLLQFPVVLGHEAAGVVRAVGTEGSKVRVGDHVVLSFSACGTCRACLGAEPAYCTSFLALNLAGRRPDGGSPLSRGDGSVVGGCWFGQSSFASHCIALERNVVRVASDLPLELMGPLGCSMQTGAGSVFTSLGVRAGESIAVFGVGAVGLAAVMAAKLVGAATVLAVDLDARRRDIALELGATHALDGADPDLDDRLAALAAGLDYAFDTTGVTSVANSALRALRPKGTLGLVSAAPVELDAAAFVGKRMTSILEGDAVPEILIPQLVELWRQGRFPFDRLIKTYPLDAIATAEDEMSAGSVVKPVLLPTPA